MVNELVVCCPMEERLERKRDHFLPRACWVVCLYIIIFCGLQLWRRFWNIGGIQLSELSTFYKSDNKTKQNKTKQKHCMCSACQYINNIIAPKISIHPPLYMWTCLSGAVIQWSILDVSLVVTLLICLLRSHTTLQERVQWIKLWTVWKKYFIKNVAGQIPIVAWCI